MYNHLKNQSSPYLLQHSQNPVNWFPWSKEAFEQAKKEDKPIFLSIGYSTCHWCHVMAKESFENKEIAKILNEHFISIKVDREERPDIDNVYMTFCHAFTGHGGWPMSIFMTAEQKPFFAGTYFPAETQSNIIGFRDLLLSIVEKWQIGKEELVNLAEDLIRSSENAKNKITEKNNHIGDDLPVVAARLFSESFDELYGGFGLAPKFPTPHHLIFLTLYSHFCDDKKALEQVIFTLDRMRRGGIFDQIGYGFCRYSTDAYFLVPHFEKMLYDNALLILAYSVAYLKTGEHTLIDTAKKTAEYVFREMTGPAGEFYSAQDADSEGEEGKFYLWDYEEICQLLGPEKGMSFCVHYGVTKQGNFEGKNILNLLNGYTISDKFDEERQLLYKYRSSRSKLSLDDKILTSWNSLMICALCMLYQVTGDSHYLKSAQKTKEFIENYLSQGNLLYVGCRNGVHSAKGFLEDYAYYAAALISLYEATCDTSYLERAQDICVEVKKQFADEKKGGYFFYGTQNDSLITKPKETYDGAMPSGNSVMAYCLVRLSQITEKEEWIQAAKNQLAFLSTEAKEYAAGYSMFLTALLLFQNPPQKITVVPSPEEPVEAIITKLPVYADIKILAGATKEYPLLNEKTTYYVCRNHTCYPPSNTL